MLEFTTGRIGLTGVPIRIVCTSPYSEQKQYRTKIKEENKWQMIVLFTYSAQYVETQT